jgi:NAD-dependent dihydropyrimidine dehydrogenase PreA subunit
MSLQDLLRQDHTRRQTLVKGHVVSESGRCVQCGICSFYCPIAIDVRRSAWLGQSISESYCLSCGECVARCPRGVLRFERSDLFAEEP